MRCLPFLCTSLLFTAAAVADDLQYLQGLRDISYERIEAQKIGRPFHIYTMLPDSYDSDENRHYPTIYVLDGGGLMPLLTGYYRYLRLSEETEDAIIVAISYGASDFSGGNYRSTDFTAPSDEREYWGGAEEFRDFLEQELIPVIEAKHRSDASRRIIFGHSLGGQFVLFTAQTKPMLFWGHIASNPALHRNLDFFLNTNPEERSNSNVFVGTATEDDPRFRVPAMRWIDTWSARPRRPWNLRVRQLEGHSHLSSPPAAFRQGLAWLFTVDSAP